MAAVPVLAWNCSYAALPAVAGVHAEAPWQGPQQPRAWLPHQPPCVAALNAQLPCLQFLENMRGPQARAAVERVEREIAASQAAVGEAAQVRRQASFHVTCLLYLYNRSAHVRKAALVTRA